MFGSELDVRFGTGEDAETERSYKPRNLIIIALRLLFFIFAASPYNRLN